MPIAASRARLALWLAWSALALTTLAALLAAVAVVGYRKGWIDIGTALNGYLTASVVASVIAVVVVAVRVIAVLRSDTAPGVVPAMIAVIGAFALLWAPLAQYQRAMALPPLHDVTTDLSDPPAFATIPALAAESATAADAVQIQKKHYPDIMPITLPDPPPAAFAKAHAVAKRLGWTIVAADPAQGRIEATQTSFWFRFTDDIVIRVRPQGEGSRVDVRSLSPIALGDIGKNARRIRKFTAVLSRE